MLLGGKPRSRVTSTATAGTSWGLLAVSRETQDLDADTGGGQGVW